MDSRLQVGRHTPLRRQQPGPAAAQPRAAAGGEAGGRGLMQRCQGEVRSGRFRVVDNELQV